MKHSEVGARGHIYATKHFSRHVGNCSRELEQLLREDVEFHGELLPHVYFGDVSAWAIKIARHTGPSDDLKSLMEVLEEGYESGDTDVRELISASFLENTYDNPVISKLYGPWLSKAANKI